MNNQQRYAAAGAPQDRLQDALHHIQAGRPAQAEPLIKAVLAADARNPDALHLLGLIAYQSGQHERALTLVTEALAAAERSPLYWNTLGSIQRVLGRIAAAIDSFGRAIELAPGFVIAHNNRGNALLDSGRDAEAVAAFRRALELAPPDRALRLPLARALMRQQHYDEAADVLGEILAINPGDRVALDMLHECRFFACDWAEFERFADEFRRYVVQSTQAIRYDQIKPAGVPGVTRADQLVFGRATAARVANRAGPAPARTFARTPKAKLNLGYISADFRDHPVAHLTVELIERHNRARFGVSAYAVGPDDTSPVRERLIAAFDRFTDLRGMTYRAAADRIAADGIDVLVDLTGYAQFSAMQILALRPAPVQVNFLGYPGTLGADFVDYIVADRFIIPPDHAPDYAEAAAYLPDCYMPNDTKRAIEPAPARAECGLPARGFVFCCFNKAWKITPAMFRLWLGLLRDVPDSVLWLRDHNPASTRNLRAAAEAQGLGDRLVFAPRVDYARHLARLGVADLFLDTLPYNAHATASDALWAGLPVLTCVGDTFAARVGGSVLSAAGLPELITTSLDEYRALALRLATDRAVLQDLREKLRATRLSCAFFDSARFTRNLEALYARMWERHVAGEKPAAIELS